MTTHDPTTHPRPGLTAPAPSTAWPEYVSAALSVWLFISAFAWAHTYANRTNTWIVAILMFAVSIWAMVTPVVRYANAVLAAWLFVSTIAMSTMTATVWNNVLVAIAVFILAFIPAAVASTHPPRSRHTPVNL